MNWQYLVNDATSASPMVSESVDTRAKAARALEIDIPVNQVTLAIVAETNDKAPALYELLNSAPPILPEAEFTMTRTSAWEGVAIRDEDLMNREELPDELEMTALNQKA